MNQLIQRERPFRQHGRTRYPLSSFQYQLWIECTLDKTITSFHSEGAFDLPAVVSEQEYTAALDALIYRHEALRTIFEVGLEGPEQIVLPYIEPRYRFESFADLSPEEAEDRLIDLLVEIKMKPFNLETGPLLSTALVHMPDGRASVIAVIHHVVVGAEKFAVFADQFRALLTKECTVEELPPVELQNGDYAVWEQTQKQTRKRQEDEVWWAERLRDLPSKTTVPGDRSGTRHKNALKIYLHEFSGDLAGRVSTAAREVGVTPFMFLFAAFKLMVARQTGEYDVIVGSFFGTSRTGNFVNSLGVFVRTLIIRTNFSDLPTVRNLVTRVSDAAVGARDAHTVDFEELAHEYGEDRSDRAPFFSLMFQKDDQSTNVRRRILARARSGEAAKFDLNFRILPSKEVVGVRVEYRASRYSKERVDTLVQRFGEIIDWMTGHLDDPVTSFGRAVVPEVEDLFNPQRTLKPEPGPTVIEMIEKAVASHPSSIAISQPGRTVLYADLWRNAERLASALLGKGMRPLDAVAVSGRSSISLITGLVAVLRAGGRFVLVDRSLPPARIDRIAEISRPVLWISADDDQAPVDAIRIDGAGCMTDIESGSGVRALPQMAEMRDKEAYLSFTSGSLGLPKGVRGTHAGLSNFLQWEKRTLAVGEKDRVAQLTALSFDAVLRDLFLPLSAGGCMVIPGEDDLRTPEATMAWLQAEKVSILHTVPSMLSHLLTRRMPPEGWGASIRAIFVTGEPFPQALVVRARTWFPRDKTDLYCLWGTTECSLAQAAYLIEDDHKYDVQPIGRPVANIQNLILDSENGNCTIGELGEIVTRSPLSRCEYLNPEPGDEKKFIVNPYRSDPDDILYKTGDLGRRNMDGTISIVGRIDDQVKIRGVLVVPPEISAALNAHPDVQNCHVSVEKDSNGDQVLVAYVVPENERVNPKVLREYLARDKHPSAVPTRWAFISDMPILPSGKLDRAALKALPARPILSDERPPSSTETRIQAIWRDVLGLKEIGLDQSFFTVGGHSLLATVVISRLQKEFGLEIPLRTIMVHQTIEAMANALDKWSVDGVTPMTWSENLVPVKNVEASRRVVLIHPIGGTSTCYAELGTEISREIALIGTQAPGIDGETTACDDVADLARYHLDAVIDAFGSAPLSIFGWSFGGLVAFEMANQAVRRGLKVENLFLVDAPVPDESRWGKVPNSQEVTKRVMGELYAMRDHRMTERLDEALEANDLPEIEELAMALAGVEGIGSHLDADYLRKRGAVIEAHIRAMKSYPIDASLTDMYRVVLFISADNTWKHYANLAERWQAVLGGGAVVELFPGDHRSMMRLPLVRNVADRLGDYMAGTGGTD